MDRVDSLLKSEEGMSKTMSMKNVMYVMYVFLVMKNRFCSGNNFFLVGKECHRPI